MVLTQLDYDGQIFVVAYANQLNSKIGKNVVHMKGSALQLFKVFHYFDVISMVTHSAWLLTIIYPSFGWNHFIGKFARWVFILDEYDFDIVHMVIKMPMD
jgi:hypothetical protein